MKSKRNSLLYRSRQKLIQAKRFVFNRRGDGVHSPYAFHLITKVIRNPYPYDCFRFLAPKHKALAQKIKQKYGDKAIYRIKTAELVFRLAVYHNSDTCLLFANEESLLFPYLQARGQFSCSEHCQINKHSTLNPLKNQEGKGLIILEDCNEKDWDTYLGIIEKSIEEREESGLMLIINSQNPLLRKQKKDLVAKLSPKAYFSLNGLDILVWRKALTQGVYKVYCKR